MTRLRGMPTVAERPAQPYVGVPVAAPVVDGSDGAIHDASLPAGRYVSYRHLGHPDQLEAVTAEVLDPNDWETELVLQLAEEDTR